VKTRIYEYESDIRRCSTGACCRLLYTDTIYYVVIRIFGASDLVTGQSVGMIQNITEVLLISELDDNETRLSALEVLPLNQYTVKTKLPTSGINT